MTIHTNFFVIYLLSLHFLNIFINVSLTIQAESDLSEQLVRCGVEEGARSINQTQLNHAKILVKSARRNQHNVNLMTRKKYMSW